MPIISIRDLVVEYDGRRVLNGLNLDIEHGETMVLLGGSGSGKSTLLRQIIGLERPKSGSVHVKGVFVTNSVIERLRASGDFARVKPYDGRPDTEDVLSGRLEKLEEIDYAGGVKVEVAISAQMTNLATGLTVWTNAVSDVGEVNKRDVPAVVSEMNRTMERAIKKLLSPVPGDVATGPTAAERN